MDSDRFQPVFTPRLAPADRHLTLFVRDRSPALLGMILMLAVLNMFVRQMSFRRRHGDAQSRSETPGDAAAGHIWPGIGRAVCIANGRWHKQAQHARPRLLSDADPFSLRVPGAVFAAVGRRPAKYRPPPGRDAAPPVPCCPCGRVSALAPPARSWQRAGTDRSAKRSRGIGGRDRWPPIWRGGVCLACAAVAKQLSDVSTRGQTRTDL